MYQVVFFFFCLITLLENSKLCSQYWNTEQFREGQIDFLWVNGCLLVVVQWCLLSSFWWFSLDELLRGRGFGGLPKQGVSSCLHLHIPESVHPSSGWRRATNECQTHQMVCNWDVWHAGMCVTQPYVRAAAPCLQREMTPTKLAKSR